MRRNDAPIVPAFLPNLALRPLAARCFALVFGVRHGNVVGQHVDFDAQEVAVQIIRRAGFSKAFDLVIAICAAIRAQANASRIVPKEIDQGFYVVAGQRFFIGIERGADVVGEGGLGAGIHDFILLKTVCIPSLANHWRQVRRMDQNSFRLLGVA